MFLRLWFGWFMDYPSLKTPVMGLKSILSLKDENTLEKKKEKTRKTGFNLRCDLYWFFFEILSWLHHSLGTYIQKIYSICIIRKWLCKLTVAESSDNKQSKSKNQNQAKSSQTKWTNKTSKYIPRILSRFGQRKLCKISKQKTFSIRLLRCSFLPLGKKLQYSN